MAAEPSQFLNEMPLELIEDLSYGSSWLSFARGSTATANRAAATALRGEKPIFNKPKNLYTGKTYNSSEAIAEFFKNKGGGAARAGGDAGSDETSSQTKPSIKSPSGFDKLRAQATPKNPQSDIPNPKSFVPGSHVKHEKYGRGLVLRREGTGDNVKLTVSFPGYGQKKLIEKYANLEQA
jgi:DNA helicase-2/ATP-dependent DNA helicase PcrA